MPRTRRQVKKEEENSQKKKINPNARVGVAKKKPRKCAGDVDIVTRILRYNERKEKGAGEIIEQNMQSLVKKSDKPKKKKDHKKKEDTEKYENVWIASKAKKFSDAVNGKKPISPVKFYKDHFHKNLQWSKVIIAKDSIMCPTLKTFETTNNIEVEMFQLHLFEKHWVHIAPSKVKERKWGLFASRRFEKHDAVCVYLGRIEKEKKTEYRCKNVDAKGYEKQLFFGAHFINSAMYNTDEKELLPDGKKPKEKPNVCYRNDYLVQAIVQIKKNEEILGNYNWRTNKTV